MAVLKCKMCGGDIEVSADKTFGTCDSCGSTMTLPKVDDDQRAAAFNRGNHFRRTGDFDKALSVYERIVAEDDTDAEAHWCCALCRFGIEYVEDPTSYEYLPTCHRASFDSFLEDMDYLAAVERSDGVTRRQYQKDAAKIAEVQRGILATSQNEEPFDVFICYKESDDNGQRTVDSTLAQDIYYQLTEAGRRVFFARITLEDKVGTEYEPYIFAALNSAKVMIAVGTKPEHFNAVWVKNEWSRFLAMMKKDRSKLLLPCYRDMDPYDLPEALSVLQGYDMAKIGFVQDLIRGVNKVLDASKAAPTKETVVVQSESGNNTAALLKRGYLALEDGEWKKADDFFEQALNLDAENSSAYIGKLCAERNCQNEAALNDCAQPLTNSGNYQKALRFGDAALQARLRRYDQAILDRNEEKRRAGIYADAQQKKQSAKTEDDFKAAAAKYWEVPGYRDADERAKECMEQAKALIYAAAQRLEQGAKAEGSYKAAAARYREIPGYRDADERTKECMEQANAMIYAAAQKLEQNARTVTDYQNAAARYRKVPGYRDADKRAKESDDGALKAPEEIKIREAAIAALNAKREETIRQINVAQQAYRTQKTALEKEMDSLGLFSGKKRKEIDLHLSELTATFQRRVTTLQALLDGQILSLIDTLVQYGFEKKALRLWLTSGQYKAEKSGKREMERVWRKTPATTISANESITVGLRSDGTVVAAGYNFYGHCNVSGWRGIVAVSAGSFHTVGLRSDGTVVAVGTNEDGQCNVSGWTDIVAVATGYHHTVGLRSDGSVVAVGSNSYGQCNVSGWTDIVAVAAGGVHTVGLRSDGTVVAVGDNGDGRCNVSGWTDIAAVAGLLHTVGLRADGTVVAAKDLEWLDVSEWTDIVAVAAGLLHMVGLRADGTVVAVGSNDYGQCDVSDWTDIVAVAADYGHTVGLRSDGTVVAVGSNNYGQCDVSDWTDIMIYD